jgi:hypothetical protein
LREMKGKLVSSRFKRVVFSVAAKEGKEIA